MPSEFYTVVSQIIPVLFLALTIQSTLSIKRSDFDKDREKSLRSWTYIVTLGFLIAIMTIGEARALYALYAGDYNPDFLIDIIAALIFPVAYIILQTALTYFGKLSKTGEYFMSVIMFGGLLYVIVTGAF